jgi:hypothetical protein
MRVVYAGAIGAVIATGSIWLLIKIAHWDALGEDVRGALGTLLAGALSFLGGYFEHKRAERAVTRASNGVKNGIKNGIKKLNGNGK